MSVTTLPSRRAVQRQPGWLVRLFDYKPFLIVVCLTPAIGLLLVFLTYPLGLGVWLAFTDTTIGRRGVFVGLENFQYLLTDPIWWNAVFYSVFYTAVATFGKFALGFWLAIRARNLDTGGRRKLVAALWNQLRRHPSQFLWSHEGAARDILEPR